MEWINEKLAGLQALLVEMWDVLKVFGGVFDLLGWLANYLGPFGFSLFLLSLLALGFINSFSPLSKLQNYIIVTIGMVVAAFSTGAESFAAARYLSVMAAPLAFTYGLKYLFAWTGRQIFKTPRAERLRRVEELTAQLSKEIAALKTGG